MTETDQSKQPGKRGWKPSRTVLVGILVVSSYVGFWLVQGILYWAEAGWDAKSPEFVLLLITGAGALGTAFHLWWRVPKFPEGSKIRTLFKLMGVTFIPICAIFTMYLVDTLLGWNNYQSLSGWVNEFAPEIVFYLYDNPDWKTSIPMDSLLTFGLILFGISFYLLPMERYVKHQIPWHTISMLAMIGLLPIMVAIRKAPLAMSIALTIGVFWILYNFLFLFYLYFKVAIQSSGKMRISAILIAVGLVLFIFTWVATWATNVVFPGIPDWGQILIQAFLGGGGLTCFNAGFWLIRPE